MSAPLLPDLRRLAAAAPARRAAQARALLAADPPWEVWRDALNALHHTAPLAEARAAAALAAGARALGRRELAARFLLLEARGTLRGGSPARAAARFEAAERALRAVGMRERAAAAAAASVDALALAGRPREALARAAQAARHLRGPALAAGRAFLAINRGNALRLVGDLDAARRAYASAAARLERLGDAGNAALGRLNEGVALLEAGAAEAAAARCAQAEQALRALGRTDMAEEARYNRACADVRCGRLGEAVTALEELAAAQTAAGQRRRAALCRMDLADALTRAGDAAAAEREALAAAEGFRRERALAEQAEALGLAARAADRRDRRRGRAHRRRALSLAERAGRPGLTLRLRLEQADRDAAAGRAPRLPELAVLARRARRLGQREVAAEAELLRARALLLGGRAARARAVLDGPELRAPSHPWLAVAARALRGLLAARAGRTDEALARLGEVAAFVEQVEAALPGAWLRSAFLLEHLDPWLARVDLLLARGTPADRRAAAGLLDDLARRRFERQGRAPAPDARLAALRARLESLYDRLARTPGSPARGGAGGEDALLARARRLERALASRWRRVERRGARTAAGRPPPSAGRRARAAAPPLAAGEALLRVWVRDGRARALREDAAGVGPLHDLGPVDALAALAERLPFQARRAALPTRPGEAVAADLVADLERLAARLLAPLAPPPWPERLTLLLDPALPDLPFEVLPADGQLLAQRTALLRAPRRAAPAASPAAASTGPRGALAVLALSEPGLPGVESETQHLQGAALVLSGAAATREALSRALTTHDAVHVAGHGFDAPAAPPLAGVRLADGWYGAADLPPRIRARLVVLAACRTGRAGGREAQAWGGLPDRLLASGARCVLWTAQDVEDAASAALVVDLHRHLAAGASPAEAFGRALAHVAAERGHVGALLPFRLSGFPA